MAGQRTTIIPTQFVLAMKKFLIISQLSSPNVSAGSSVAVLPSDPPTCPLAWRSATDCRRVSNANCNEMGLCRQACKSEYSRCPNSAVPACPECQRTGHEFLLELASCCLIPENALLTYFGWNRKTHASLDAGCSVKEYASRFSYRSSILCLSGAPA